MPMRRTSIVEEDINFVQSLSGKTLLLTGGSGFVGSYLVETIIAFNRTYDGAPCRLILPTRSLTATSEKWPHFFGISNVVWFEWDGRAIKPPSDTCDYVIHAASPADPADYLHDPMQMMEDITTSISAVLHYAMRAEVCNFLYLSSGAAYGQQPPEIDALDEASPNAPAVTVPASCYGEAKRYSELLCRSSGIPVIVARLFAFVGPYQNFNGSFAVPDFIRQATQNHIIRIHSDGSALRTYCYAADLCCGLWKLLLNGRTGELYNVGADSPRVTIRELADMIADQVGHVEIVIEGKTCAGPRSRYIPNTDKFKQIYSARFSLQDGLRRTITSYHQAHAIAS
jgi:nucleoside-diphosphate-sugar epimerase